MQTTLRNFRYGIRGLTQRPGFTLMAVLVLALGIGANTAMFSLVNAFLFKPLVIHEPERIVGLYSKDTKQPDTYRAFSYPEYVEIRNANTAFTDLLAHNVAMVGIREGETTRRAFADVVSSNYFATYGVSLWRGRPFTADEERPRSAIPVAILNYSYWRKRGADPDPLGQTIQINGKTFTIVGVAARGFTGSTALISADVYLPLGMYEAINNDFEGARKQLDARDNRSLIVIGRLRDGLDLSAADAQLVATSARMEKPLAQDNDQALVVRPLSRLSISTSPSDDGDLRIPSLLLLFLSGIVLLIASLNVANMLLARSSTRKKEMGIRLALGAGRSSLMAQGFTEGLILALLGGLAGLAFAYAGTSLLVRSLGAIAPIQIVFEAAPDVRVLVATFGFCLLSTILFSLGPSWNLSRPDLTSAIKSDDQTGIEGGKGNRLFSRRNLLVIGQLSLSLTLLATAGLFVRSALEAIRVDPGFRMDRELLVEIDPSLAGYDEAQSTQVTRTMLERLRTLPQVDSASVAATVPFGMVSLGRTLQRASDPPSDADDPSKKDRLVSSSFNVVGTDYFSTLGIPILRGREFRESETASGAATGGDVAILDKLAAEKLWPKQDPIGQRIRLVAGNAGQPSRELEVVGVVAAIREHIVGGRPEPRIYVPFGRETPSNLHFHVALSPQATPGSDAEAKVLETVRRELRAVDARVPVLSLHTLRGHLEAGFDLWIVRTAARIFGLFGLVALVLAAVGLYGVRAFTVARRTREIGIRMAIGANANDALRMVLREGMMLTAIGTAAGLVLALLLGKVLSGMLYQVSGTDPVVFTVAPLVLAAVSLLACYVPASRAARIHPMVALRGE